jgi:hypothetical protein
LKTLDCRHNNMSELEHLPKGLEIIYCNGNAFTKIKNLPPYLKIY